MNDTYRPAVHHDKLLDNARELGLVSASIDTLTEIADSCPYATVQISRNLEGRVFIRKRLGWGMLIGYDNDPFPRACL